MFTAAGRISLSFKQFIKRNFFPILLVTITLIICARNYTPGTFLTGWDTLHPEFNYRIYWARILGGVWQEHQSLGGVASQAHASEIPRIIILMLFNILFPMSFIRYAYAFLMLILGPLGLYVFLKHIFLKNMPIRQAEIGALAGGLLYVLNLGTLQHFYVPLEMFLTHFGFLGWVFYFAVRLVETPNKKTLFLYSLVTFLTSSQAHTPTLFYAFLLTFMGFLGTFGIMKIIETHKIDYLMRGIGVFLLTLVLNFYWLLPGLYFAINHGREIQASKIHQLFSEEAFLQNKEFGNVRDIIVIKNFLFNWGEHVGEGQFGDLLNEWNSYHAGSYALQLGYVFFALIVLGVFFSSVRSPLYSVAVFAVFIISIFFLFNVNPPFGFIFIFLQNHIPLFKEAFRFPFTKFSITLMFSYAVFFGAFVGYFTSFMEWVLRKDGLVFLWRVLTVLLVVGSLVYFMWPAFQGYLISPSMRVKIPDRYFEMFKYFDGQSKYGRVMNLPIHSFWGWVYYNWDPKTQLGYQGAGFLWFGIKQPLINREFDRWNLENEQPYRDVSWSVYSMDPSQFELALNKYQIRWIIVDKSVIAVGQDAKVLFTQETQDLLQKINGLVLAKDFGEGLLVYEYFPKKEFVSDEIVDSYYLSGHSTYKEYGDPVYEQKGTYVNSGDSPAPFLGITNDFEGVNPKYIESKDGYLLLTNNRFGFTALHPDGFKDSSAQFEVFAKLNEDQSVNLSFKPTFKSAFEKTVVIPSGLGKTLLVKGGETVLPISVDSLNTQSEARLGVVGFLKLGVQDILVFKDDKLKEQPVYYDGSVLEPCGTPGKDASFSVDRMNTGFVLTASNVNACLTMPVSKFASDSGVGDRLLVVRSEISKDISAGSVCILDSKSGLCANSKLNPSTSYLYTKSGNMDAYFLRFFVRALSSGGGDSSVEYDNSGVSILEPSATFTVDFTDFRNQSVVFGDGIRLYKSFDDGGEVATLLNNPRYCNGSTEKITTEAFSNTNGTYSYISTSGLSVCDSFFFPNKSHSFGYILEVKSRNINGVPLRICLTNEFSKRCDIYTSLGFNKDLTTEYFIVPPFDSSFGYTLNVSNLEFGSDISVNELSYVALVPFPFKYIRSLESDIPKQNLQPLFVHNQAYESGWVVLCGWGICPVSHVKVNNWANGWMFPGGIDPSLVTPFFWPEVLEWLGLVINMAFFGILGFRLIWRPKPPKPENSGSTSYRAWS